jgi:hypothetical protein
MTPKIKLICKSVWYYSSIDEDMFFEWIQKIPSIIKYDGQLDELYLYIKSKRINNNDLREIVDLFYRYKIDMKQLSIFLNKTNKAWFFDNKQTYWHKNVYPHKNNSSK